jgi:hypothetical protein
MQKIKFFNVKWTFKDKNLQQSCHLKFKNLKLYILRKFQCTSLINSSNDDALFYFIYFNTTLTYFLSQHFSFFQCDRCSVVMSKVQYESIIFLEFIQKIYDDSH